MNNFFGILYMFCFRYKHDGMNETPLRNITHIPSKLVDQKLFLDKLKSNLPHYELILLIRENKHLLNDNEYKTYRYNISKNLFF